ncbi:MAG: AAA family ATPase [Armatimonadetes bacterium]|nr:AAA family ATPase [Armatimonadota bacterium]
MSGGVEAQGILDSRLLPDSEFLKLWDSIIVDQQLKDRLLSQAILSFTLRPTVDKAAIPLHGVILLVGEPGTGKTSLARGLAARTAEVFGKNSNFTYLEVEPHALASAALGKSQRAVTELLGTTIAEPALRGPLVVLLDEVETLAADRSKLSLEANPIDVHRATDAVLAQLDQLAARYPRLLFVATSNFPRAIDAAFVSRADLVLNIGMPNAQACTQILTDAVQALAKHYTGAGKILSDSRFRTAAELCVGLDGRRIRKIVPAACTFDKETALDPNRLTAELLLRAVQHEKGVSAGIQEETR